MRDSEEFWDKTAGKYSRQPVKDPDAYRETMDRTKAYLSPSHHPLEVGCGTGTTALMLADSVRRITASDISSNMIDIARAKAADQRIGNVDFVKATPFDGVLEADAPYDVVMAFNFLHLLEDPAAGIRRIHALLKPGGLFVSKTVCLREQLSLKMRLLVPLMQWLGLAPHVTFLKAAEIEALIADAGFEIVETGTYPPPSSRFVVARRT